MVIRLYFDGACDNRAGERGLPSLMGCGVAVIINGHRAEEYEAAFGGGVGTSNVAEWLALTKALEIAVELKTKYPHAEFKIYGDSQLIVRQFIGQYAVKQPHLKPLAEKAFDVHKQLGNSYLTVEWISRDKNIVADVLSKKGVDSNPRRVPQRPQEPKKIVAKIAKDEDGRFYYEESPF